MKRLAVLLGLVVMGCSSGASGIDPGGDPGGEAGGSAGSGGSGQIDTGGKGGESGEGGEGGEPGASGSSGQDEGGAAGSGDGPGGNAGSGDTGGKGGKGGSSNTGGTSGDSGSGPFGGSSSGGSAGSGSGGSPQVGCVAENETAEVFGHSALTLYRVDPATKAVQTVGNMACGGFDSVIDLAINKEGDIYGTTFSSLVKIDKTNAKCTVIKGNGSYPNSLSFVPAGTVFPDKEALVGYQGSTYVVIDPQTGAITTKGALTGGYTSSGDIVSVIGAGTYLTVKGNECNNTDCLVEVNPSTGDLIKKIGSTNYSNVFGLAYWANQVYGFTDEGVMFTYDLATNKTTKVTIPNAPFALSFYGAGSSTCARTAPIIN